MKKVAGSILFLLLLAGTWGCEKRPDPDISREETRVKRVAPTPIKIKIAVSENLQVQVKAEIEALEVAINEAMKSAQKHGALAEVIKTRLDQAKIDRKIALALGELKSISIILEAHTTDLPRIPQVQNLEDLVRLEQDTGGSLKDLPLKDPWGNHYLFRFDRDNPKKIWLGSGGSDGKFEGFEQKDKKSAESDDIILTDDIITLGPKIF